MTVTEESRHRLHQALDRTIGPEEATTLMEHLPPVGWSDVATKQDLDHHRTLLEERMDHHRTLLEERVDHHHTLLEERVDNHRALLEGRMDHRFEIVDQHFEMVDQHFEMVDQHFEMVDQRFEKVDLKFDGLKDLILALGKKIDAFDRRFEAQAARTDLLFWQFVGLIVTVSAVVFTGIKLFGG